MKSKIEFDHVLVADGLAWSLFALAKEEGLLFTRPGEEFSGRSPSAKSRQAVLSLLLLFDKLTILDLSPNDGTFRIPDLERQGVLEVVAASEPSSFPAPLPSNWKPTKIDPRQRPDLSLRRGLALLTEYQPLIIDRLMTVPDDFSSVMTRALNVNRRKYYNALLDLAVSYALSNEERIQENILTQTLSKKFYHQLTREFFDFQYRGDKLSFTNVVLLMSLVFAGEIAVISELSSSRHIGVATQHYTGRLSTVQRPNSGFSTNPSDVPRSFGVLRSILNEEGHFFPRIENIEHALKLRNNPHIRAFRQQLRIFHEQLLAGDSVSIMKARAEISKAKRILERSAKWDLALNWLTYISLPAGIVESILGAPPIAGTSLAVLSAVGTATNTRRRKRNEWVMFGM